MAFSNQILRQCLEKYVIHTRAMRVVFGVWKRNSVTLHYTNKCVSASGDRGKESACHLGHLGVWRPYDASVPCKLGSLGRKWGFAFGDDVDRIPYRWVTPAGAVDPPACQAGVRRPRLLWQRRQNNASERNRLTTPSVVRNRYILR